MKTKTKNNKNRYDFGSFVEGNGAPIGAAAGMLGQAIGGGVGSAISSAGQGAALGTAIAPGIGTIIGGGLGLIGGILGNGKKKRAEEAARKANNKLLTTDYANQFNAGLDNVNLNPYGTLEFAKGGVVPAELINIEKGELQINPETGKILREYDKINPETGGMYEEHSKGKDPKHNFVTAEPGTFIITKKTAKDYKKAIDNNDKLHQSTILQNINNAKTSKIKSEKMADGGGVGPLKGLKNPAPNWNPVPNNLGYIPPVANLGYTAPQAQMTTSLATPTTVQGNSNGTGINFGNALNYAPAIANIARGMFGKVETQPNVAPVRNSYASRMLNSMPEEVSFDPVRRDLLRQQNSQFNQIRNSTSGSPIARANMNNVYANTNQQLGRLSMDNQMANNQVRGQRASIYGNLGQMDMQSEFRAQQINQGIYQSNLANQGAKDNLLTAGLGQLQQTYQNQNNINQQKQTDALRNKMLYEMFPNLRFYQEQFKR